MQRVEVAPRDEAPSRRAVRICCRFYLRAKMSRSLIIIAHDVRLVPEGFALYLPLIIFTSWHSFSFLPSDAPCAC